MWHLGETWMCKAGSIIPCPQAPSKLKTNMKDIVQQLAIQVE